MGETHAVESRDESPGSVEPHPSNHRQASVCFFGLALPLIFLRLGASDVVLMEGILADGARWMAQHGEWAVPRLHGELYTYKPPLLYWLTLASFEAFGESPWSLRLPSALAGLCMGWTILHLVGRRVDAEVGLYGALASLSGLLVLEKLHLGEWELMLTASVGVAIVVACALLSQGPADSTTSNAGRLGEWWWLVGYGALGVAFLTKGIPALMFYAPGCLLAVLVTRGWRRLFAPWHLAGGVLFLALAGGWIVAAWQAQGWEAFAQPLAEAEDKGLQWTASAVGYTLVKPLLVLAFFLPWTLALPGLRGHGWQNLGSAGRSLAHTTIAFVVGGVATFMLVPSTESRYLLPLAAPVGILCGLALVRGRGPWMRRSIRSMAGLLGATVLLAVVLVTTGLLDEDVAGSTLLLLAMVSMGLLGTLLPRFASRLERPLVSTLLVLAMLLCVLRLGISDVHRSNTRSQESVAVAFGKHLEPDETLWAGPVSKHFRHSSLTYYLRRPVRTVVLENDRRPEPGAAVMLYSDEHRAWVEDFPFGCREIERVKHRRDELILCRVDAGAPVPVF